MQLIRGWGNRLSRRLSGCVVTLGNFDGLHLGHQQLLTRLKQEAARLDLPAVVITFEPSPQKFFSQQRQDANAMSVPKLMDFREKWHGLAIYGIDVVICLRFDQMLAHVTAENFVETILVEQLGVKVVIVGDDFRFGAQRKGDMVLLQQMGQRHHFNFISLPTFMIDDHRVSSTRVRQALQAGDLLLANRLLAGPYYVIGKVVHNMGRGRLFGFPTANIDLANKELPLSGIFVVQIDGLLNHPTLFGVASVGVRLMFSGNHPWLEVFLFDFDEDIYGCRLQVKFLHKLRDGEKFVNEEALVQQIAQDVVAAKEFLRAESL